MIWTNKEQTALLLDAIKNNLISDDQLLVLIDPQTDISFQALGKYAKNTIIVDYAVEQAAFSCWNCAAYMLNANHITFAKDNKLNYGVLIGYHDPYHTPYLTGFELGVQWANEHLKVS